MTHCVLRSESACHKSRQISFDFFWIITHVTPLQFGWGWQLGFCRCKMKKCGGGPLQNIKITNIGQIRPCILYNYKIQALNGGAAPKFVTCDPASFTFHICHLRLEKSITCDSSPFWIQTRKGMGWDVNAPSHLQTKKALAHIHVEQGVGWGGMSTFPGTCKPRLVHIHVEQRVGRGGMLPFPGTCEARMAQKHWHIYTLNKGWGGVGCYPFLALANRTRGGVGWDVALPWLSETLQKLKSRKNNKFLQNHTKPFKHTHEGMLTKLFWSRDLHQSVFLVLLDWTK